MMTPPIVEANTPPQEEVRVGETDERSASWLAPVNSSSRETELPSRKVVSATSQSQS